jgi:hypothetical protein
MVKMNNVTKHQIMTGILMCGLIIFGLATIRDILEYGIVDSVIAGICILIIIIFLIIRDKKEYYRN